MTQRYFTDQGRGAVSADVWSTIIETSVALGTHYQRPEKDSLPAEKAFFRSNPWTIAPNVKLGAEDKGDIFRLLLSIVDKGAYTASALQRIVTRLNMRTNLPLTSSLGLASLVGNRLLDMETNPRQKTQITLTARLIDTEDVVLAPLEKGLDTRPHRLRKTPINRIFSNRKQSILHSQIRAPTFWRSREGFENYHYILITNLPVNTQPKGT